MSSHMNEVTSMSMDTNQETKDNHRSDSRDRDSGIFMSDSENIPQLPSRLNTTPTTPSSTLKNDSPTSQRSSSLSSTSTTSPSTPTDRRLRRPAELNLGTSSPTSSPRPKSELELRYDLIRNSSTRSKAALKSPTQLLKDRLNLSPKKSSHEEKTRTFTPPRAMVNGCILPGPSTTSGSGGGSSLEVMGTTDVKARTEKSGRPAWWCKFDKLVVFDGVVVDDESGETKFLTRTSKGLTIARRRGDCETVVVPMDCQHCCEMLNRTEWKYDVRVCKRSVCWDCKERCRWESEKEVEGQTPEVVVGKMEAKVESARDRADSVLQEDDIRETELMLKIGIETPPRSPFDTVGGIEERMLEPIPLR